MSIYKPTTRREFKENCLLALGKPVVEINVEDDQIEACIEFALQTFWDYHFDGAEKCYYKYEIQTKDLPGHLSEIEVANGGIGYDNADIVVITANTGASSGSGANASITTDANGTIIFVTVDESGDNYMNPPVATVTSANGVGASLVAYNGGYIPIPENIIGAINIFDISSSLWGGSANMFNIMYQIALNDLYNMSSVSMVPYFMARMNIAEMGQWFVGKQPIRYSRHKNKMYLDMDWQRAQVPGLLVAEAYQIVDPEVYREAWNDRWLKMYCQALIKRQWGTNMKKYQGIPMPGGLMFSGQQIYDEASRDIKELEQRMIMDYGFPVMDMIG